MAEHDTPQFWDEMWGQIDEASADSDSILATQVKDLPIGRALEYGCGTGGNALWLAEQGWDVTAVDFSAVAIDQARSAATTRGLSANFVVADAAAYVPAGEFDLIASFYIQLFAEQRAAMLAHSTAALAPGGTLLFVSHDRSSPPPGWTDEDLQSLTTPEEIASELPELTIEQAIVLVGPTAAGAHTHEDEATHDHDSRADSAATLVRATRPR